MKEKPNQFWKYLGAMMSEKKDGHMAASFTRVLGLLCFILWSGLAICEAFNLFGAIVPTTVSITLWSLLGLKGVKDMVIHRPIKNDK